MTVSDEEFERSVEAAVSEIAEHNKETEPPSTLPPNIPEKSAPSGPQVTQRNSMEGESYSRRRDRRDGPQTSDSIEDNPAVAGLLRTIQKPLSTIGKIFSDETGSQQEAPKPQQQQQQQTPRLSPAVFRTPQNSEESQVPPERRKDGETQQQKATRVDAQEAAARQATAEAAEARRINRAEHKDVVE